MNDHSRIERHAKASDSVRNESDELFRAHLSTYHKFVVAIRWVIFVHLALGSVFFLGFFTDAGWGTAVFVGFSVFVVGLLALSGSMRPNRSDRL